MDAEAHFVSCPGEAVRLAKAVTAHVKLETSTSAIGPTVMLTVLQRLLSVFGEGLIFGIYSRYGKSCPVERKKVVFL